MHSSHASSSGLRPRQRTFTSCTECRRRKQRCNQAKDRPCNNCARRYPPVLCTYSDSSSPPPSIDRVIDLQDDLAAGQVLGSSVGPHPSYLQTSQSSDPSGLPATTAPSYYSVPSSGYYSSTPPTRSDYSTYQGDSSRSQYSSPVTSSGGYATVDAGYYQSSGMDYSSAGTQGGCYPTSDQQQGSSWYSASGDPGVFVGATSSEYYYVDPDPDDVPSTRG